MSPAPGHPLSGDHLTTDAEDVVNFCRIAIPTIHALAARRYGIRTPDIMQAGMRKVGTQEMGDALVKELDRLA